MKNKKRNKLLLLVLLVLGISIGFAALSTTLKINGVANIPKNSWSIYWDNVANKTGVTPVSGPTIGNDSQGGVNTQVTFEVNLNIPGDYYEFTVDAVNNGTIDAMITKIEYKLNGSVIDDNNKLPDYIKYSVTYLDGKKVKLNHLLRKKTNGQATRETYKVRVEYDRNIVTNSDINTMNSSGVQYNLSLEVKYSQATDDARDRLVSPYQIDRQVPGTITKGDEACTGTTIGDGECFYIMNIRDDGTALLLPKYNLNISDATETEIRQSTSNEDSDNIRFSQTNYYDNHYEPYTRDKYNIYYVYDELSYPYQYIEKYKDYLTSLGLDIIDARLLKYEEMIDDFGCITNVFHADACTSISQYLGRSFWIGSVYNYDSLYRVNGSSLWINMYNSSNTNGVRPIIIIDADDL